MEHERFMEIAIQEAEKADWPFGAAIVKDGILIASAGSGSDTEPDPTAHAEVNVIRRACGKLGMSSLKGCILYASCEPCALCVAAAWYAGIRSIVFGSSIQEMMNVGAASWGEDLVFPYNSARWPDGDGITLNGGVLRDKVMDTYAKSPKIHRHS